MPLIQAQQPDLIILQASQIDSLELCHQLKQQTRLAWIYCILLDDQPLPEGPLTWNWEAELTTTALAQGADAYIWIPNAREMDAPSEAGLVLQEQLLEAQIQAGLRSVQNYRELMRTNDLLSAIALSDPLTELNNRRALEWELPRQIQNARSRALPLSLLMLDVDFFKTINDTYGHLVGDQALKLLSARIRYNLRFYDTPFRYGGEEFVIILSNTDRQEAPIIANRLCQLISEEPFAISEDLDLHITISAGAASLKADDDPKGVSLLGRADQNLLQAKFAGRNRVVSSVETEGEAKGSQVSSE
jgi:two-component system cell cycle response regulator